jgi:hypothetical protein
MLARWTLAAGLAATWLLASLVVGCGKDDAPPAPGAGPAPAGRPAPSPKDPAEPSASHENFVTAEQCGRCHVEIYAEWKASYHGQAMVDPLFLDLTADVNKEECIRCHAPVALRDVDFQTPIARAEQREDAVSCLTCHRTDAGMAGPFDGLKGACRPVYDPDQQDVVKLCFGCHNQHDTGNEWLAGPWSPEAPEPRVKPARTCLDCHMPEVERPLVPGGPPRKGRRHTWPGGHDMAQLRKAATIEAEVTALSGGGHRFQAWVTNVGAGHYLPTDARHRSLDVYLALWDAQGNVLLDPLDANQQGRALLAKYRKNYRGTGLVDTQIPPLARVSGLGDRYKGFLDVPEARAGRGELWLVYRLTQSDTLTAASLEDGPLVLYRARLVARAAFTFGGR